MPALRLPSITITPSRSIKAVFFKYREKKFGFGSPIPHGQLSPSAHSWVVRAHSLQGMVAGGKGCAVSCLGAPGGP